MEHTSETGQETEVGSLVPDVPRLGTLLGITSVLLTTTALYRYTTIGSWIRKVGGTNKNDIDDMHGFSSYTQKSGDMFLGDTRNYISYQPI
ncbi:PIR Superfamily Protein [Plasmodium ovale curtisi]|uniref:PIR Superfamily Protein n=1 Tax=Plasmodium ovale curtisi TaxID=864141 RepID=A0A1A8XE66_PLAOA|nr:PIR Superfamily Protein [Plasmodium ovale curtisi]